MVLTLTERGSSHETDRAVPSLYAYVPYTTGSVLPENVKLSERYGLSSPPVPEVTCYPKKRKQMAKGYELSIPPVPEVAAWGARKSAAEIVSSEQAESVGRAEVYIPELEWSVQTHPVLTNKVRSLLQTLRAIVVSRASQLRFPIRKTIVSVFTDPTEGESKAILRLTCDANVTQALAFWDSLEPDLQDWLQTLSESERTIFLTNIALRVYWQQ